MLFFVQAISIEVKANEFAADFYPRHIYEKTYRGRKLQYNGGYTEYYRCNAAGGPICFEPANTANQYNCNYCSYTGTSNTRICPKMGISHTACTSGSFINCANVLSTQSLGPYSVSSPNANVLISIDPTVAFPNSDPTTCPLQFCKLDPANAGYSLQSNGDIQV